ncbi:MAG TPA: ABC transporter permease [Vicinamibacterales bacterium]|jgi:ABC-type antimicrobial peptide transport system permease subunit
MVTLRYISEIALDEQASVVAQCTAMSLWVGFRIALSALGRNKLRTFLTMLGIIIGVAAVIAMVAVGQGAQAAVESEVRSAGANLIFVSAGNYTRGGESVNIASGLGAATTLSVADADAIARIPGVQYRSPGVTDRALATAGPQSFFTVIQGIDRDWPAIYAWGWARGAAFSPDDIKSRAFVAVLGQTVSTRLFGTEDPIGRTVTIRNHPFRVVGVTAASDEDQPEAIFVPYTTLQDVLGVNYLQTILVAADEAGHTSGIADAITALLRARHHLDQAPTGTTSMPKPGASAAFNNMMPGATSTGAPSTFGAPNDFTVATQAARALTKGLYTSVAAFALANLPKLDAVTRQEMASTLDRAGTTMTALLGCIAAVSLIVGGIGIMNIMLVSVRERTREIGIRMAVGAHARDVMVQFLTEAITLSLIGGIAGIVTGFAASRGIERMLEWPTAVSAGTVVLAFAIAAGIGIFFGYYPAVKASRLDPIDALRCE